MSRCRRHAGSVLLQQTVKGVRTHQVHVCALGHFQIAELLSFPQYLREHEDVADTYGRLKLAAILEGDADTPRYIAFWRNGGSQD